MTDLKDKTVEELMNETVVYQEWDDNIVVHLKIEAGQEIARRLETVTLELQEAQKQNMAQALMRDLLSRLIKRIMEHADMSLPDATDVELQLVRQLATPAHDAETAANAKAEALEFAAEIADDGIYGKHGNDIYTRQNLASRYRQEAIEYRNGRKE